MIYDELARLFHYPDETYAAQAEVCPAFRDAIAGRSTEQLQELFIQTFDLNPDCALDIGWHLFGENYERGEFLVKLRREMRRYGVEESSELPDHLTHVLPLLGRMPEEDRAEFCRTILAPALDKMLQSLRGAGSQPGTPRESAAAAQTGCPTQQPSGNQKGGRQEQGVRSLDPECAASGGGADDRFLSSAFDRSKQGARQATQDDGPPHLGSSQAAKIPAQWNTSEGNQNPFTKLLEALRGLIEAQAPKAAGGLQ